MPKVYIKTDIDNRITAVISSAFLADTSGWIFIDEGEGDRYTHAQGNYFSLPLLTDEGVYRYKFVDGKVVERTAEEMSADIPLATTQPTDKERLEALEAAMLEHIMGGLT
ncbi:MAG: hypothetical protein J6R01_08155 [Alistipes sp.]|nr:hypothetical protein [Alistipes sp.]